MVQFYRPVFLTPTTQIRTWVDPTEYMKQEPTLLGTAKINSPFVGAVEMLISDRGKGPTRLVWAGDYYDAEPDEDANLYKLCTRAPKLCPEEADSSAYNYIVNYTKRQFVSKDRTEKYTNLHPLPILTAEGHGYGTGDYPDEHALVGCWARDEIGVSKKLPAGFIEIIFNLA
jgi:hypothetical protein